LGNDVFAAYAKHNGAPQMLASVRRISLGRAVAAIAAVSGLTSRDNALWLTRELRRVEGPAPNDGNIEEDLSDTVQQARESHDLVLVEGSGTRTVYWLGEKVDVNFTWFPKCWEFLRALAEQAQHGGCLDFSMLGLTNARSLVQRKANLKRCGFPEEILEYIVPDGHGVYRLKIHSNQVKVVDLGVDDWGMDSTRD
jgi:hypothetical protein